MREQLAMVVAHDQNLGIGSVRKLPWHLPTDLQHFCALTTRGKESGEHSGLIMGRLTWLSIPEHKRPLPDRYNCVLTSGSGDQIELNASSNRDNVNKDGYAQVASSFDQALNMLRAHSCTRIFAIGGESIYKEAIARSEFELIYVTKIEAKFDCDRHFPHYEHLYRCVDESRLQEESELKFRFLTYQRILT